MMRLLTAHYWLTPAIAVVVARSLTALRYSLFVCLFVSTVFSSASEFDQTTVHLRLVLSPLVVEVLLCPRLFVFTAGGQTPSLRS